LGEGGRCCGGGAEDEGRGDELLHGGLRRRARGVLSSPDGVPAIAHRAVALRRVAALLVGGLALAWCGEGAVTRAPDPCGGAEPPGPGTVVLNAYYLQEEAARALRRGEPPARVDEVLAKARRLGVTVVRTNGFNDAPAKAGDSAMQVAPLVYDEEALRGLDVVLARAAAHDVQLVLPLGNYWDDYGGARQYVAWAGLPDPRQGDPRFFTDRGVVHHYRAHVARLLQRASAVDGVRYADHPAILAFELLNEPRGDGLDAPGTQLRAWVDALAQHVKGLAPAKLVGTGEEGFDVPGPAYDAAFWSDAATPWLFRGGASFLANTASPFIDYASAHLYPEAWSFRPTVIEEAGRRWIGEHAAAAASLGKPLFLSEFGLRRDGRLTLPVRRAAYASWFSCARAAGALGAAPWLFAYDDRPAEWDPYTFYLRDGTEPDDPVNLYAGVVEDAARASPAPRPSTPPPLGGAQGER
jgi:mannan endo-1,4-beta-mannosidase